MISLVFDSDIIYPTVLGSIGYHAAAVAFQKETCSLNGIRHLVLVLKRNWCNLVKDKNFSVNV